MNDDHKKKLDETETPDTTPAEPKHADGAEGDASPETMAPVGDPETTPKETGE